MGDEGQEEGRRTENDGVGIRMKEQDEETRKTMSLAIANSRVTRPLPGSRRVTVGSDLVPKQAEVPKSMEERENTRRLIVVLSQVSIKFPSLSESAIFDQLPSLCSEREKGRLNSIVKSEQYENLTV